MGSANPTRVPKHEIDTMNSYSARDLLLMVHGLSLRLAPLYAAQDSSELTRRALVMLVVAAVAGWHALKRTFTARADHGAAAAAVIRRLAPAQATGALLLVVAAVALVQPGVAAAGERAWLGKSDIEGSLLGKPLLSKNLASGAVSHWEFRRDGTVEASRSGLGRASGTWNLRDDGQMCVTMMNRTGCRYWFRKEGAFANADTSAPDAVTVAEVRYE
jgi:hypothetical protein